jgi:hypothetical protein
MPCRVGAVMQYLWLNDALMSPFHKRPPPPLPPLHRGEQNFICMKVNVRSTWKFLFGIPFLVGLMRTRSFVSSLF